MDNAGQNSHIGHRERVRAIVEENGLRALLPHQVLEFLLFYGIPYKDTKGIAHQLLRRFGCFDNVLNADVNALMQVKGMTRNAALLLTSLPEVFTLYHKSKRQPKYVLGPDTLLPYLDTLFADKVDECLYLLCMDVKQQLIHTDKITSGNSVSLQVAVKEIVETALRHNAKKIILAHNHPSAVPSPSEQDIKSTNALGGILDTLDIKMIDHIIMGLDTAYSFYLKSRIKLSDGKSYAYEFNRTDNRV